MIETSLRDLIRRPGLKLGTSVFEFDTPGIGHILKAGGAEYVFLDMEHSGIGIDAMKRLLRYCEAAGLPTMVRPPSKEPHHIGRVLDIGAGGLILPMVGSGEEARRIALAMKYPPVGARGVALGIAHDRYRPGPVREKFDAANQQTAFIALIETAEGIANVDDIAAVPEVDVLWIGHFDLSCSLGIPGEFDNPRFHAAVEQVIAAARRHGKSLGRLTGDIEEAVGLHGQGFDLVCYSGDVWILQQALASAMATLRERCR